MLHRRRPRPGPARRARVLLTIGAAGLLALAGCSTGKDAVGTDGGNQFRFVSANETGDLVAPADRKPAPSFGGKTLDGRTVHLGDYRGKVVLVNFWGSWCPPCRAESPDLQALYRKDKAKGLQVLGIDVRDHDEQLAQAFVHNKHITYPSIFDPNSSIALNFRNYPPNSIPSTILIDRKGRVAGVYLGAKTESDFRGVVRSLLAEHAGAQ